MEKAKIGLIGLAVMGANLARNIANKKFPIVVYNRTTEKTDKFIEEFSNKNLEGSKTLKEFVSKIAKPRKIIIMVQAGAAVDSVIKQLTPLLDKNDLIIDCGNSNYKDTQNRFTQLKEKGLQFIGCGVSGGEEGALNGPSLMPGGSQQSYKKLEPIFKKIAAKDFNRKPCVTYIGNNGAGHYVKTVHNGIEYAVMQMMAEAYDILRTIYKLKPSEIAKIFEKYNKGPLASYLFEIGTEVLNKKDEFKSTKHLIDFILDKAAQKGTGTWTAIDALEHGTALPTITEAVFARLLSSEKEKRITLSKIYKKPKLTKKIPLTTFTKVLESALYAGMLSAYAQGYALIANTAKEEKWDINLSEVSRIWEGGCIIRAEILNFLHKTFKKSKPETHLFEIPEVTKAMKKSIPSLRELIAYTALNAIATPSLSTALSYFESITQENLPANFIQGLRDYFGAHTYERTDKEGHFHTDWQ